MMIGNDHVDPDSLRMAHDLKRAYARVHANHKSDTRFSGPLDHFGFHAVAFGEPVRDGHRLHAGVRQDAPHLILLA